MANRQKFLMIIVRGTHQSSTSMKNKDKFREKQGFREEEINKIYTYGQAPKCKRVKKYKQGHNTMIGIAGKLEKFIKIQNQVFKLASRVQIKMFPKLYGVLIMGLNYFDSIIKCQIIHCRSVYKYINLTCVINIISKMIKTFILLACVFGAMSYESDGNLLKLGDSDFAQALEEFPFMIVKFFAPWCGHCKKLAPAYIEVADAMNTAQSPVKVAEVDCTVHKATCGKYGVKGYPTLNFFAKGTQEPTKYPGARSKDAMVAWLNEKSGVQAKPAEQAKTAEEQAGAVEPVPQNEDSYKIQQNLYVLTETTFKKALDQFDFVLVKFYAPWCGHCKKLAPAYASYAKSETIDKVVIAEVDCTVHKKVCSSNGVKGYPTLKLFAKGNEPIPFKGARTEEGLKTFIEENVAKLIPQDVPEPKPEPIPEEL